MIDELVIRFAWEAPSKTWFPCGECTVLLHALKQDELFCEDASTSFVEDSGGALFVAKITFRSSNSQRDSRVDRAVVMRQKVETGAQVFPKLIPDSDN